MRSLVSGPLGVVMYVCLYTPSRDASGMGAHMLDLVAELSGGHDVSLMAWPTDAGQRLLERAAALGATAVPLPHPRDPRFAGAVVAFLQARPADVFHVHVGTGRENFDGARAARRAGVPVVIETLHLPWLLRPHKKPPFLRSIEPVDRLITVSHAQRGTYERLGVPAERLTTIPNGVRPRGPGPGRAAARRSLGLDDDQLVVMTVGRLVTMKGQRYLVEATPDLVARFPDVAVVIVGQGHLYRPLSDLARELGVSASVHLPGHRPDARMLLDAADVFVLPSRHEGMPLAAMEAMDAGLPVVATNVIGTAEVVADGETGLLVPSEDPRALASALTRLLADPDLRARYARAGRRRYLERFTSARMTAETLAMYEEALQVVPSTLAG